jgi:hypothetical protein
LPNMERCEASTLPRDASLSVIRFIRVALTR